MFDPNFIIKRKEEKHNSNQHAWGAKLSPSYNAKELGRKTIFRGGQNRIGVKQ